MLSRVVHAKLPMQPAGTVDVLTASAGNNPMAGVARVGGSYGDWTLYLVRDIAEAVGTIPSRVDVHIQVGHDRAAVDAIVYPPLFISVQSLQTWLVYHIVASELSCDLTITHLAGAKPARDRVNAWVAPGRPTRIPVRHDLLNGVVNVIPTFATHIEIHKDLQVASTLDWIDEQGFVTQTDLTLSVAGEIVQAMIPIPNGARAVRPQLNPVTTSVNPVVNWWMTI